MNNADILKSVNEIFIDILDNDDIVLTEDSKASDIEEWDSLTHIQLVVAIEKRFKLHFTTNEIQSWKNVGQMIESIVSRQA